MQEQMIETRGWKKTKGMHVLSENCRLCNVQKETVMHFLLGLKVLAGVEYIRRHNNALTILIVEWAKQEGLLPKNTAWYKLKWNKGTLPKGNDKKICLDFEYKLRKITTARRPDATIEDNKGGKIW